MATIRLSLGNCTTFEAVSVRNVTVTQFPGGMRMKRGPAVGALVAVLAIVATSCATVTGGIPRPVAEAAAMAPPPTSTVTRGTGEDPAAVNAPAAAPTGAAQPTTAPNAPPAGPTITPPTASPPEVTVDPTPSADTPAPDPPPAGSADPSGTEPAPAPVTDPANWADASDDEIRAAAGQAVGATERFWTESFAAASSTWGASGAWSPPELWNGDGFYDSDTGTVADCGDGKNYIGNAFFCGNATKGSGFLAWDLQFFHRHLDLGRTMVDMVIAHETGHAVQARLVHDGVAGALFDGSRRYELQADCLGGAALGRAVHDGYLTLPATAPDEMLRVAAAFGGDPAGHGTPEQRDASFQRGFAAGDPATCLADPGA